MMKVYWPAILAVVAAVLIGVFIEEWVPRRPMAEVDLDDLAMELAVAAIALAWLFFVLRAGLAPRVQAILFSGMGLYALSRLLDLLDEFHATHQEWLAVLESTATLVSAVLVTVGLYLWQRDNRRTLGVLARSSRRYQRLSELDAMTGVYNRGYFNRVMQDRIGDGVEEGELRPALMILDIDSFKVINDGMGHQVGDEVIKLLARCVQETIRDDDLAFRYGGDEFAVLMESADSEVVEQVGERIRERFSSESLTVDRKPVGHTVSVGAARLRSYESASELLSRADQALRAAKGAGKNRVVLAEMSSSKI